MSRVSLRERARYRFDNAMSRGTPALIGLLALASIALIAVITALVLFLTPKRFHADPLHALWDIVFRGMDSGAVDADFDRGWVYFTLSLVMTIGGIFIVSSLVGVLASGLEGRLSELRKGRSRVVESHHTVVLGWSDQIFTIVSEFMKADDGSRSCVAILAPRDKVEMEDEIRSRLPETGRVRVVCRTGDPMEQGDLDIMRPEQASVIIVPAPDGDDPDVHVIKTLLALRNRTWPARRPHVVGVISVSANLPAASLAGGDAVKLIDAGDITARLLVQSRRQPGLSVVCTELLNFDGDEIYMRPEHTLVGATYGEALAAYETASLIGLRRADGVVINPPAETVVADGDEMIVIAASKSAIRLREERTAVIEEAISRQQRDPTPVENTLMLGWNGRGPTIVRLLDPYLPKGSSIEIAGTRVNGHTVGELGALENLTVTTIRCDPMDRRSLEALEPSRFHHVILLADDGVPASHADSHALVTLLHLRDIKERGNHSYAIVSELKDESNRRLAQVTRADDFVVGNKLITLLLTQLSRNKHLSQVFAELFDAAGSEIYLKPADEYLVPGADANFATILEAARRKGETAIGYRRSAQAQQAPHYGVVLNPPKAQSLTLGEDDRVVVLARV